MFLIASYLCFLTCALGVIFSLYVLLRFRQFRSTYLLLAVIFCLCWIEFYMFALSSRYILQMPFLFRTAFPFRAFAPVFLWLYVWAMLHPNRKFRMVQLLHFVIPLIITLGLLPDFLRPVAYKMDMLQHFYSQNNSLMQKNAGIFPAGFIQPLLLIFGLAYVVGSICYIVRYGQQKTERFRSTNRPLLHWVLLVAVVITVFILLQAIQYLSLLLKGDFSVFAQLGQSISLITLKVYLLVNPLVIENMDGCMEVPDALPASMPDAAEILPRVVEPYAVSPGYQQIHRFFTVDKGFRDPDLSLASMAGQFSMSRNKLSHNLQQYYGMNFPEIINRFRIHHFLELLKEEDSRLLKVETLILQSGFQHKTTFYLAFKRVMHTNPSTYLKQYRK